MHRFQERKPMWRFAAILSFLLLSSLPMSVWALYGDSGSEPGFSCLDILKRRGGGLSDGLYYIYDADVRLSDVEDLSSVPVYCDMTTDGGGFTGILKTFRYTSYFHTPESEGSAAAEFLSSSSASSGFFKLSDNLVQQVVTPLERFDVLVTQEGFYSSHSTGALEYALLYNVTGQFSWDSDMKDVEPTEVRVESREVGTDSLLWAGYLNCTYRGGHGLSCPELGSSSVGNGPNGGSGCTKTIGKSAGFNAGYHAVAMGMSGINGRSGAVLALCNGNQDGSATSGIIHRFFVRETEIYRQDLIAPTSPASDVDYVSLYPYYYSGYCPSSSCLFRTCTSMGTCTPNATDSSLSPEELVGESSSTPGLSCLDILVRNPYAEGRLGRFWISVLSTPVAVVCDQRTDGGGYMLAFKTWYRFPGYGSLGSASLGGVEDALTLQGNAYKLPDYVVQNILQADPYDVLADQAGYSRSGSNGNYEFVAIRRFSSVWKFDVSMKESVTPTTFHSYSTQYLSGSLQHEFWSGNLLCDGQLSSSAGAGIYCTDPESHDVDNGFECMPDRMGTGSYSGEFYMFSSLSDSRLAFCNGRQSSSGSNGKTSHRFWVREYHNAYAPIAANCPSVEYCRPGSCSEAFQTCRCVNGRTGALCNETENAEPSTCDDVRSYGYAREGTRKYAVAVAYSEVPYRVLECTFSSAQAGTGLSPLPHGRSCFDILQRKPFLRGIDGYYVIQSRWDRDPEVVYCDMTRDGGGYTMIAKTWYRQSADSLLSSSFGDIADARTFEGNEYKLSDLMINDLVMGYQVYDVLGDQYGFYFGQSDVNREYAIVRNYTGPWRFDGMAGNTTSQSCLVESYDTADDQLIWSDYLVCDQLHSHGVNCNGLSSPTGTDPRNGYGCLRNLGTALDLSSATKTPVFAMKVENGESILALCNGNQTSRSGGVVHRFYVREKHRSAAEDLCISDRCFPETCGWGGECICRWPYTGDGCAESVNDTADSLAPDFPDAYWDGETPPMFGSMERPVGVSCLDVLILNPLAKNQNGLYYVNVSGVVTKVFCDMSTQGGGFTLAMKTYYRIPGYNSADLTAEIGDFSRVEEVLTYKDNAYKLSDEMVRQITGSEEVGDMGRYDVLFDQLAYYKSYSEGNNEYEVLRGYSYPWSMESAMPPSLARTSMEAYRRIDGALAWVGNLHCGSSTSSVRGIYCTDVDDWNPKWGSQCLINVGGSSSSSVPSLTVWGSTTSSDVALCSGDQSTESYNSVTRLVYVRERRLAASNVDDDVDWRLRCVYGTYSAVFDTCRCRSPYSGLNCTSDDPSGRYGLSSAIPGLSCREILETSPDLRGQDGLYWVDAGDVLGAVEVFCDMTRDGGGYMQVANYYRSSSPSMFTSNEGILGSVRETARRHRSGSYKLPENWIQTLVGTSLALDSSGYDILMDQSGFDSFKSSRNLEFVIARNVTLPWKLNETMVAGSEDVSVHFEVYFDRVQTVEYPQLSHMSPFSDTWKEYTSLYETLTDESNLGDDSPKPFAPAGTGIVDRHLQVWNGDLLCSSGVSTFGLHCDTLTPSSSLSPPNGGSGCLLSTSATTTTSDTALFSTYDTSTSAPRLIFCNGDQKSQDSDVAHRVYLRERAMVDTGSGGETMSPTVTPFASQTMPGTVSPTGSKAASTSAAPSVSAASSVSATVTHSASRSGIGTASVTHSGSMSGSANPTSSGSSSLSRSAIMSSSVTGSLSATSMPSKAGSASPSLSTSFSPSPSSTASEAASLSATRTVTKTASITAGPSASLSVSDSGAPSVTASKSMSRTAGATASGTVSKSMSETASGTASKSMGATASGTASATATESRGETASSSVSASRSMTTTRTATQTSSRTSSVSSSLSRTASGSMSPSLSTSLSSSPSTSLSPSSSPTKTASSSVSPSFSPSPSSSRTSSLSAGVSTSSTAAASRSASFSVTLTPSKSRSLSTSPSESMSPSMSISMSASESLSLSSSLSLSASLSTSFSSSLSVSHSTSASPSRSMSRSAGASSSSTSTASLSLSLSSSKSASDSVSPSMSSTSSPSVSLSLSHTSSASGSQSASFSPSKSLSLSRTPSTSETASRSPSLSLSLSTSPSKSSSHTATPSARSASRTPSLSLSKSPSRTRTPSKSGVSLSPSSSVSRSSSLSLSHSVSLSLSASPSPSASPGLNIHFQSLIAGNLLSGNYFEVSPCNSETLLVASVEFSSDESQSFGSSNSVTAIFWQLARTTSERHGDLQNVVHTQMNAFLQSESGQPVWDAEAGRSFVRFSSEVLVPGFTFEFTVFASMSTGEVVNGRVSVAVELLETVVTFFSSGGAMNASSGVDGVIHRVIHDVPVSQGFYVDAQVSYGNCGDDALAELLLDSETTHYEWRFVSAAHPSIPSDELDLSDDQYCVQCRYLYFQPHILQNSVRYRYRFSVASAYGTDFTAEVEWSTEENPVLAAMRDRSDTVQGMTSWLPNGVLPCRAPCSRMERPTLCWTVRSNSTISLRFGDLFPYDLEDLDELDIVHMCYVEAAPERFVLDVACTKEWRLFTGDSRAESGIRIRTSSGGRMVLQVALYHSGYVYDNQLVNVTVLAAAETVYPHRLELLSSPLVVLYTNEASPDSSSVSIRVRSSPHTLLSTSMGSVQSNLTRSTGDDDGDIVQYVVLRSSTLGSAFGANQWVRVVLRAAGDPLQSICMWVYKVHFFVNAELEFVDSIDNETSPETVIQHRDHQRSAVDVHCPQLGTASESALYQFFLLAESVWDMDLAAMFGGSGRVLSEWTSLDELRSISVPTDSIFTIGCAVLEGRSSNPVIVLQTTILDGDGLGPVERLERMLEDMTKLNSVERYRAVQTRVLLEIPGLCRQSESDMTLLAKCMRILATSMDAVRAALEVEPTRSPSALDALGVISDLYAVKLDVSGSNACTLAYNRTATISPGSENQVQKAEILSSTGRFVRSAMVAYRVLVSKLPRPQHLAASLSVGHMWSDADVVSTLLHVTSSVRTCLDSHYVHFDSHQAADRVEQAHHLLFVDSFVARTLAHLSEWTGRSSSLSCVDGCEYSAGSLRVRVTIESGSLNFHVGNIAELNVPHSSYRLVHISDTVSMPVHPSLSFSPFVANATVFHSHVGSLEPLSAVYLFELPAATSGQAARIGGQFAASNVRNALRGLAANSTTMSSSSVSTASLTSVELHCVLWNSSLSMWDSSKCHTVQSDSSTGGVTCRCDGTGVLSAVAVTRDASTSPSSGSDSLSVGVVIGILVAVGLVCVVIFAGVRYVQLGREEKTARRSAFNVGSRSAFSPAANPLYGDDFVSAQVHPVPSFESPSSRPMTRSTVAYAVGQAPQSPYSHHPHAVWTDEVA